MIYHKKNVPFLLVSLLIIIFFSGNANAEMYSFSAGSTFGDKDIFNLTANSVETINGNATGTEFASDMTLILNGSDQRYIIIETNRSLCTDAVLQSLLDPYYVIENSSQIIYVKEHGNHTNKVKSDERQAYGGNGAIDEPGTLDVIREPLPEEKPTLTPEAEAESVICVDIKSSPEGAEIWIDEEYSNVTPSTINFDRLGNHTFKLVLNRHKTYQESFFISESMTLDVILEPLPKETPTYPTLVPEPSEVFEKNQKTSGNTTKVYREESLSKSKSKSSSAFFHPSPTPPGFLALSLLIAIFFVYFFKFKNKR